MLRSHFHRIVLTTALMTGFIGAGFLFDQGLGPVADPAKAGPVFSLVVHQSAAPAEDEDKPRRTNRARNELSWPFFSFGRTGKRASW